MADDRDRSRDWGGLAPLWAGLVSIAVLLLAYPLSVGPVAKFYEHSPNPPTFWNRFYQPISSLMNDSQVARTIFIWYLRDVWRIRGFS